MFATETRSIPATRAAPRSRPGPPRKVNSLTAADAAVGDRALEVDGGDVGGAEERRDADPRVRLAVLGHRLAHALAGRDVAACREHHRPHEEPSGALALAGARHLDERPLPFPTRPVTVKRPIPPLAVVAIRLPPTTSETAVLGPAQPVTVSGAPGASQAGSLPIDANLGRGQLLHRHDRLRRGRPPPAGREHADQQAAEERRHACEHRPEPAP